jgi:hypothetical protein
MTNVVIMFGAVAADGAVTGAAATAGSEGAKADGSAADVDAVERGICSDVAADTFGTTASQVTVRLMRASGCCGLSFRGDAVACVGVDRVGSGGADSSLVAMTGVGAEVVCGGEGGVSGADGGGVWVGELGVVPFRPSPTTTTGPEPSEPSGTACDPSAGGGVAVVGLPASTVGEVVVSVVVGPSPVVSDVLVVGFVLEVPSVPPSANAVGRPLPVPTAVPMPSARARAPIRPMYLPYPMTVPPEDIPFGARREPQRGR